MVRDVVRGGQGGGFRTHVTGWQLTIDQLTNRPVLEFHAQFGPLDSLPHQGDHTHS